MKSKHDPTPILKTPYLRPESPFTAPVLEEINKASMKSRHDFLAEFPRTALQPTDTMSGPASTEDAVTEMPQKSTTKRKNCVETVLTLTLTKLKIRTRCNCILSLQ